MIKKTRTQPRKRSRKRPRKKEITFFFSWSLSCSSSCFLTFLFSFLNSHLWYFQPETTKNIMPSVDAHLLDFPYINQLFYFCDKKEILTIIVRFIVQVKIHRVFGCLQVEMIIFSVVKGMQWLAPWADFPNICGFWFKIDWVQYNSLLSTCIYR